MKPYICFYQLKTIKKGIKIKKETIKCFEVELTSASPILYNKPIISKKEAGDAHEKFEDKTWKERLHFDPTTKEVYIPGRALSNTLVECARFLSESVPGKGKATYTKHFEAGISIPENIQLGIDESAVSYLPMFVPSDGKKGGSSRVWKKFPVITEWTGKARIIIIDPILIDRSEKVIEYLDKAGKFVGLLAMRPRKGGEYGRFLVKSYKEVEL